MKPITAQSLLYMLPPTLSLLAGLFLAFWALLKGRDRAEARLFALVCLWMSLLCPAFISHHLMTDKAAILALERLIHFFYVYIPFVFLLFFHRVMGIRRPRLGLTSLAVSFIFSLTTFSEAYISGLNTYSWGYIARGGPAFQVFGLYSLMLVGYCVQQLFQRLRHERNPVKILKFKYLLLSFGLSGLLTFLNIPAMNGIDFYPLGNLTFIPLSVMAYGLLRHRLLDMRRMLRNTLLWLGVSSLVLLPNLALFLWLRQQLAHWSPLGHFLFILVWFSFNLLYFFVIQPRINQAFNRHRTDLVKARVGFLEEVALLKNLNDLSAALAHALVSHIGFPRADVYVLVEDRQGVYRRADGEIVTLQNALERFVVRHGRLIERFRLPAGSEHQALLALFEDTRSAYLVPMIQEHRLLAVIMLPEKTDRLPLNNDESRFIREVMAAGAIALFNSMLYQSVSDLRDRLQTRKVILTQEIRDREKAQRSLSVRERQYRLLAENVMDVIWIINADEMQFTYISPSIERLTGYTPREALNMPLARLLTPASLEQARAQVRPQVLSAGSHGQRPGEGTTWLLNSEIELVCKDGSTVWTEVSAGPLREKDIAYTAILGVCRDVTERRRNQALRQAKMAADKANQAKSEFLANMSHELRTPLNHIIGFTELVADQHFGPLNETQADYLHDVLHSSQHLLELINDILDLSKVEAGKMAVDPSDFQLLEVLEGSLTMVKEKSLKHGIQLNLETRKAPEFIHADKRKFKQILYNLLSNAVKFTPDGGRVSLTAAKIPADNGDGPRVEISVKDSGIGIASGDLERIFNTFEQVESSAARQFDGTGLGLALSRRLVEMHDGRIWAESEGPNRGSRFVFTLPS